MADLTTLAKVKAYMLIPTSDTSGDSDLSRLITAFSKWFLTQTNRESILSASYTEQRHGMGGESLTTKRYPVTAVTLLKVDGQTIPASDGVIPGYVFDELSIFLIGYRFSRGRGNVALSYTVGYPTVPEDIEQAVIDQVVFTSRRQPNLGSVAQSMNGVTTVTFSQRDLAPGVAAVVANYKTRALVGL